MKGCLSSLDDMTAEEIEFYCEEGERLYGTPNLDEPWLGNALLGALPFILAFAIAVFTN